MYSFGVFLYTDFNRVISRYTWFFANVSVAVNGKQLYIRFKIKAQSGNVRTNSNCFVFVTAVHVSTSREQYNVFIKETEFVAFD